MLIIIFFFIYHLLFKTKVDWKFPDGPVVRGLSASTIGARGSIPGQLTKISQASENGQKKGGGWGLKQRRGTLGEKLGEPLQHVSFPFAVQGLCCCTRAFSRAESRGGFLNCGDFSCMGLVASWHWDLPRPGTEPMSPVLAGGFLTTGPPGKVLYHIPYLEIIVTLIVS